MTARRRSPTLSLDQIANALAKSNGGDILGGKTGNLGDLFDNLLNKLGPELENKLKDGLGNSGSTTTTTLPSV